MGKCTAYVYGLPVVRVSQNTVPLLKEPVMCTVTCKLTSAKKYITLVRFLLTTDPEVAAGPSPFLT